jgi:hypothetical protein
MSKKRVDGSPADQLIVSPAQLAAAEAYIAPRREHGVTLRKDANGDWVAATLVIEGDRVVDRTESKPNFKAYGVQQFKIMAGKLFARADKGEL